MSGSFDIFRESQELFKILIWFGMQLITSACFDNRLLCINWRNYDFAGS